MMARLDRCEYCDYSKETGSEYANIKPGENGEVRLRWKGAFAGMLLCDACIPKGRSSRLDGEVEHEVLDDDEAAAALSEV